MARTKIALLGNPIVNEDEAALEAIIPGHLVMLTATGLQNNTANEENVARAFALERDERGDDIDTAYAIGDYVKMATFAPGQRVYAWLASGHDVAKGAYLNANNAGLLYPTNVSAFLRIARAVESVDTSGSAPLAGTRIRVEVV